jgi:hypothetical protein
LDRCFIAKTEEPAWIRSLTKASLNRKHYLAGINSNDHSDAWGSTSNNPRGGLVEEILFEHGLCLFNVGNAPTFKTDRAATIIDITVASQALATLMSKWKLQQEMHLSNHHLFTFNLKVQPDLMPLRKGRNLKKADWPKFLRHLYESYRGYTYQLLWSPAEIDRSTSKLHSIIVEALEVVAPIKPYRPKRSIFSWWRADL